MSTKTDRVGRRLGVPLFGVAFGVVMFAAAASQGQVWLGVAMLGIMVGYAAVLLIFGGREPVAMLTAEGDDERRRLIQWRAGYVALNVVAVVTIGGFVVNIVRGGDGGAWALLGLVGGGSFVLSLIYFSRRS